MGLFAAAIALALAAAGGAPAEVRRVEVVGAVGIDPDVPARVAPRDAALAQAQREALLRVAQDLLLEQEVSLENLGDPSADPEADPTATETSPEQAIEKLLGREILAYTRSFRILEDRGVQPALFSSEDGFTSEYVLVVEVQVDEARVRQKLVDAGWLAVDAEGAATAVELEAFGVGSWEGYQALRELLVAGAGARSAEPLEMEEGRILLRVAVEEPPVDFLAKVLSSAPPEFALEPLRSDGARLRMRVDWTPPEPAAPELASPRPGRN